MSHALVTLNDLHVRLGGKEILRGVQAAIERGKITALIGLNGSGKTTLLRTLLKEVPYDGQIKFLCGHDHSQPLPEHIGYVPQKLQIDARMPLTVRDLMALALQRWPLVLGVRRATERRIERMLARVFKAPELLDRFVEKLSGGELQRVLLALALEPEPELLLLDEPASGIDFKDLQPFYDLIGHLNRQSNVTVLIVSHELNVVTKYADHVLCLKDGRVACQGPPHTVLTPEILAQTFGTEMGLYPHPHHH